MTSRIDFVERQDFSMEKQEFKALVRQYRKSYFAFLFVAVFGWLPVHVSFCIRHWKRIRAAKNQIRSIKHNMRSRNGKAL